MRAVAVALMSLLALAGCGGTEEGPAPVDTKNDACAWCRMSVSDLRFAAQLTAPGHEPKLFDDAGCLRDWLKAPRESAPWTAWVADHRTKDWVKAREALFTRNPSVETPMASGLLAHASAASRDADPEAKGGTPVPAAEVVGPFASETR
jgi:copper chaperone NosL